MAPAADMASSDVNLSAEQRTAVERSGQDVCVVAGPGSGKTRVLVERFAWLVERNGIDPSRILAITFTEKAARMMKRRLVERFAGRTRLREAIERAWVMTIDAFCTRLLKENAIEAGLAPDFSVLDEAAANRMRREATEAALDELFGARPAEMRRLLEALALSTSDDGRQIDLAQCLLEVHESMRLAGLRELPAVGAAAEDLFPEARRLAAEVGHDFQSSGLHEWVRRFVALSPTPSVIHFQLAAEYKPLLGRRSKKHHPAATQLIDLLPRLASHWIVEWNTGLPELLREAVAEADSTYRAAKQRVASVDFTDLSELAIELLESDAALRERISGQFEHVLMDELQDTNRLQWKLIGLLRRPERFFAVGDINQSIYGFRHADKTVFDEFRASLRAKGQQIDELRENYRSRPEILTAVARVLDDCAGVERRDLIAIRDASPVGNPVELLAGSGDPGQQAEADLVADRIAAWHADGRDYGDFAILVRALRSAEEFEAALEKRKIPFVVSGGRTFLETREARDVLGLLAALVNPLDEIATVGVLRGPLVGWSDEQLLRAGSDGRVEEFEKLFGRARRLAGFVPPDRLLAMILDECGYWGTLTARGRANIDKLLAWIRREHAANPRPLAELLEDLEAVREAEAEAEAPPQQVSGAVNIMTIHAAKGLEFPVVFVSALQRRASSSSPALLFSADLGLGAKWRNPATGETLKDATHGSFSARLKEAESAEEERLFYVAMTRAEERLALSFTRTKQMPQLLKRVLAAIPEASGDSATQITPEARPPSIERAEIVLEPAQSSGQYDSSATVTDVSLFSACPRKYFLARYVGLQPEPDGPGTGAIEFGLEAHKALAGLPTSSSEAIEFARQFEAGALGQRAARAERIGREFDFMLAIEDVVLRGQIDLWFEESGEIVLVDYKTDRDQSAAEEYELQLRLYALAVERYAGRVPDRAALCFLRSGDVRGVSLGREDLESARESVRALSRAQDRLEFPMKVGEQCRRCWFYGGNCPAKLETIQT